MSKEFLKPSRAADRVLSDSSQGKRIEAERYSRLLAEQQIGLKRAMSKGDRQAAGRIQGTIRGLQDKYERALGQLRHTPEE